MKRIGILFGPENSFPGALVERINARNLDGVKAEFVETGAVYLDKAPRYAVIIDRVSHNIPFYRAYLKHAALQGTYVVNNPFWWSADDKFFNYSLAAKLGVAVPPTAMLPHKLAPNGATAKTMRNLEYPLDWDSVFSLVGECGYLKPIDGGGWRNVHYVSNRKEFFAAYDRTGELCMVYQKEVNYSADYRCFVIGQKKVRVMNFDPRKPHAERYAEGLVGADKKLLKRMEQDAVKLCQALGYDVNTVEFAVEDGVAYAIDFMNPVPDADLQSVGESHFEWIVEQMANLAIAKAKLSPRAAELRGSVFLGGAPAKKKTVKRKAKRRNSEGAALKPRDKKL